jgi:hypothetical protein
MSHRQVKSFLINNSAWRTHHYEEAGWPFSFPQLSVSMPGGRQTTRGILASGSGILFVSFPLDEELNSGIYGAPRSSRQVQFPTFHAKAAPTLGK